MNDVNQSTEVGPPRAHGASSHIRMVFAVVKWTALAAFGLFVALLVLGFGGVQLPWWFPETELSEESPYADFVGREYRVTGQVIALAWNDYPEKTKILSVSLMTPPLTSNRFVSYTNSLQPGQRVRIISAWRQFALVGFRYWYLVSVPGAGLPEGVPISMAASSDGVPDLLMHESISEPDV